MVGWNSVVQGSDYTRIELNIRHEAARYEGGSQNMIGFHGLGASLDLLASLGVGPQSSPVADCSAGDHRLCVRATGGAGRDAACTAHGKHRSGIVTFDLPGHDSNVIRRRLEAAKSSSAAGRAESGSARTAMPRSMRSIGSLLS